MNLTKSKLYHELLWRRIERNIKLPVFVGLIIWVGYIWQLTNAYPQLVTPIIITLN